MLPSDMRLIVTLLLLTFTAPAWAEWVKYWESVARANYYDPATMKINGNSREVWEVVNSKQRGREGEMSRRRLWEYDCKEKRRRILVFSWHSETMAEGEVVFSSDGHDGWRTTANDAASATLLEIACK